MAVTPVPAFTPVPPFPPLSDRVLGTYNSKAYAFGNHMSTVFMTDLTALANCALANATEANLAATAVTAAAASAVASANLAAAAANFKGLWPSLTGALNKPASVKHNGRFWALLNNLADVTASQPGVSADWTSLDSGSVQQEVTTNTTMLPGVRYVVKAAGVTLTAPLPASLQAGDPVRAVDAFGAGFTTNWNGNSVKGDAQSVPMAIPAYCGFDLYFSGSTLA